MLARDSDFSNKISLNNAGEVSFSKPSADGSKVDVCIEIDGTTIEAWTAGYTVYLNGKGMEAAQSTDGAPAHHEDGQKVLTAQAYRGQLGPNSTLEDHDAQRVTFMAHYGTDSNLFTGNNSTVVTQKLIDERAKTIVAEINKVVSVSNNTADYLAAAKQMNDDLVKKAKNVNTKGLVVERREWVLATDLSQTQNIVDGKSVNEAKTALYAWYKEETQKGPDNRFYAVTK